MLAQDEIIEVILSLKDDEDVLQAIEHILKLPSEERRERSVALLNKFKLEGRDQTLIQFVDLLHHESYAPIILKLIRQSRKDSSSRVNLSLILLVLLICISCFFFYFWNESQQVIKKLEEDKAFLSQSNKELSDKLNEVIGKNKEENEAYNKILSNKIVGSWSNKELNLKGDQLDFHFKESGDYESTIKTIEEDVTQDQGRWKIEGKQKLTITLNRMGMRKYQSMYVYRITDDLLIFEDHEPKVLKRQ